MKRVILLLAAVLPLTVACDPRTDPRPGPCYKQTRGGSVIWECR